MVPVERDARLGELAATLAAAGFLAAEDEASQLMAAAGDDDARLAALCSRRLTGEPLAWITGRTTFCGLSIRVDPGVYVPRPHTEPLAMRAAARLPDRGVALDVCTGSGAIAAVLQAWQRRALVAATDIEARAVACARRNGVDAWHGDLFGPLPRTLAGRVDLVVAVVPYVPTAELCYLQRDTFTFESTLAYDGGADGTDLLRRVVRDSTTFVRDGGVLLLELGGEQAHLITSELTAAGYARLQVLTDEDGEIRGVEATRLSSEVPSPS